MDKTPEYYFCLGAEAMRGKLATLAVMYNQVSLAQKMLTTEIPKFQEPERIEMNAKENNG